MIRFILRAKSKNSTNGAEYESLYTNDQDVPELERALPRVGMPVCGYEF